MATDGPEEQVLGFLFRVRNRFYQIAIELPAGCLGTIVRARTMSEEQHAPEKSQSVLTTLPLQEVVIFVRAIVHQESSNRHPLVRERCLEH